MSAAYSSFSHWYREGRLAPYVRTVKSSGGIIDLLEAAQPAGDMSDPAVPDLVLYQDLAGGCRVSGNMGSGYFDVRSERNCFYLAAPNFASNIMVDSAHRLRSLSLPLRYWASFLDEASDGRVSLQSIPMPRGSFHSASLQSAMLRLWSLCDDEGVPSILLARAAGCEILAALCQAGGTPLASPTGGLARWMLRRCLDLMQDRLADDISLDELAAEAGLSVYHFARMFKQSIGVPPRVYFTRLRIAKACQLLESTDRSITQIALDVGYSSNQVLARVFQKWRGISPSEYRRVARDAAPLSLQVDARREDGYDAPQSRTAVGSSAFS